MPLEQNILRYIQMNNNNTDNADDDSSTSISVAPTYDVNVSNVNGGNRNVFYLTGNTQVI